MIIGVDGNEANVEKRVGISKYVFELLRQFEYVKPQVSHVRFNIYLKKRPREDLPKKREGWHYRVVGPQKLWTQVGLPLDLFLNRPRPDVFFTPTHYAPRFSPVPTVVSVMDLSYIHFPQLFNTSDLYQLRNWTAYSVKKAKRVLTISLASKNDIIKHYQIAPDRVVVTYPGIKLDAAKGTQYMEALKNIYGVTGEYILFVGTLQPRKNIVRLIEAFALVRESKEYNDLQLVIIGKRGWQYQDILAAPRKLQVQDSVKFLDFVSDNDLASFYHNARCFILPSLYEGFGLPILEAMKYDCPVITSNVSSMPEVGGEAAIYINPYDTDDIADKIREVLGNETLRKQMVEEGKKQIKKFSWEKTAKETLQVLTEIAKAKKR